MTRSFDLEDPEAIGVGTVGPAGQRQFYLRASGGGETIVLNCEKFHIQGLLTRMQQLLEAQGVEMATDVDVKPPPPAQPGESAWTVGDLGLGYHEGKGRFVIVAREASESEEADPSTLATAPVTHGCEATQPSKGASGALLADGAISVIGKAQPGFSGLCSL